jgi:hypothetical protein
LDTSTFSFNPTLPFCLQPLTFFFPRVVFFIALSFQGPPNHQQDRKQTILIELLQQGQPKFGLRVGSLIMFLWQWCFQT